MPLSKKIVMILIFITIFGLTIVLTGCFYKIPQDPNTISRSIIHDNLTRTFLLHIPLTIPTNSSLPLVFVLHGGGGTGDGMERSLTLGGFNTLADQNQFLVVYPDGIDKNWNDGRTNISSTAHQNNIDDIGFFKAMIENLSTEFSIDQKRIYVTGMSNGAMMSFRLAVELPDLFAAAAPVGGAFPTDLPSLHNTTSTISLCMISGTNDPLVPWDGGTVGTKRNPRGTVFSVQESIEYWVTHNNCNSTPKRSKLPNKDLLDFTRVYQDIYQNGSNQTEVILYTIQGGGHTWPGGYQYFPKILIGRTCRDIDANTVIWEFFQTHPKL
ncbi:MAG: prolyl oligopeptidase family serine peptidase [Candidatus Thermoplasmatota archaeon]|nr:prolyl oligopeptidase family serine peptidase [Candidatus Thermoplasmatota archaeon]